MMSIEIIKNKYGCEIAVVLLCCRVYVGTENNMALQFFLDNNEKNWDQVLRLCSYHRIEPIVYKILMQVAIPADIALQIKEKQLWLVQQNFRQALETERIINTLQQSDIKCIPYKGVAFSKQFYGDIVSRESSDIDLVIHPRNFDKAITLMNSIGYSFEHQIEYNYFKEKIAIKKYALHFNKYKNGFREFHIEFHWRISNNLIRLHKAAHHLLFREGKKMVLAKHQVETIEKNAHYLAMFIHHTYHDGFHSIRNIVDLASIAMQNGNNINVSYLQNCIIDFNLKRAAMVSTALIDKLLGLTIPVLNNLQLNMPTHVEKYFEEQLLHRNYLGHHFKNKVFHKSRLYLKDNMQDKIDYLFACLQFRFIPTDRDIRTFKLPTKLYFMYAILKPFRSLFSPNNNKEESQFKMKER